jgi:hypothetical protein
MPERGVLSRHLLVRALRSPGQIAHFSMGQWDLLVRQARAEELLARLSHRFRHCGLTASIPAEVRWHFDTAEMRTNSQQVTVLEELQRLCAAQSDLDVPLILLKDAAHVAANLPARAGRPVHDIDILVPPERLPQAEYSFKLSGWQGATLSEYGKRTYRRSTHETPPIQDVQDAPAIKLHRAIVPDTLSGLLNSDKLLGRAVNVDGLPGMYVLATEDHILHVATRLFHEGRLPYALLDLSDLDLLLRDAADDDELWSRLTARADEFRLSRSLFYALRYVRYFLDTPIPDNVRAAMNDAMPNPATLALMDSIFTRVLAPAHASCADAFTPVARYASSVRARCLRMPAHRQTLHLFTRPLSASA